MSPRKGTHRPVGRLFSFLFIPPTGLAPSIPFPLSLPFLFLIPRGIIEKKVRGRDKGNGGKIIGNYLVHLILRILIFYE